MKKIEKKQSKIIGILLALMVATIAILPCAAASQEELQVQYYDMLYYEMQNEATYVLMSNHYIYDENYLASSLVIFDTMQYLNQYMHNNQVIDGIYNIQYVTMAIVANGTYYYYENAEIYVIYSYANGLGDGNYTVQINDENGNLVVNVEGIITADSETKHVATTITSISMEEYDEIYAIGDEVYIAYITNAEETSYCNNVNVSLFGAAACVSSPYDFYNGYVSNTEGNGDGDFVPDAKVGMYGQLYYILKDAIYGENTIIGTNQDFVLTQVAQLATLAFTLLPLIICLVFVVRFTRW